LQRNERNNILYTFVNPIPEKELAAKNRKKAFKYGYDKDYDLVVISRSGEIGDIMRINGLNIALPKLPKDIYKRSDTKADQYWEPFDYPRQLESIKSIFQWNTMSDEFKLAWVDYVEEEFDRRDHGFWFMNNGVPTYITGSHYMYLQWTKIDVGHPDFREANRIFYIFWEACKADNRCFGMVYLKIRRSGFSFMSSSECVNTATLAKDARIGILSKTGGDAKKMFTDKVVPISSNYPFFFRPIQDGMDKPKTELSYRVPASKITKNNMKNVENSDLSGLDTTIDWRNTDDNSYDGEKLLLLVHDECYAPETKILTSDFEFKKICDINIGDKVIVEGGKIKTVVKKTSGTTKRYKVNQPYGKDYIVTENHRLVFNQYSKGEVIMTPEEYINSSKFRKQHLTRVTSSGVESEDKFDGIPPYLLGLWLGDGRQSSMSIMVNDNEEPEILAYLGRMAQFKNIPFDIVDRSGCIEFRFKGINDELRKIGVYKNKHIPKEYMSSSIDSRLQLLAGIIDTDGYSEKTKGSIEIGMSRKKLVEQIRFLALSCGISCSNIRHKESNYGTDVYRMSMSGDLSRIPILTEKKSFENYEPKTRGRRNKVGVEFLDIGEYVGIQVDAENDDERKLILEDFTISMNSGKWIRPNNILNNWRVTRTCLRLGSRIIGKCLMGSTSNALDKGGDNFKKLYEDSDTKVRNANGQTKSGMYSIFVPMEWNLEGFIDKYGMPVLETPEKPIEGVYGEVITRSAIDYWEAEVESLKNDSDALNEFYRQFPRTESHAFRDESKNTVFNLNRIYQQIDYNDSLAIKSSIMRGNLFWKNGERDTEVVWAPDNKGRFFVNWIPTGKMMNNVIERNGKKYPGNDHVGSFGCDSYDISGVVNGGGSKGSLHGMTKFHMDDAPINAFFLEYISRPPTAELFYEDVLMAIHFYGMPVLVENNKPRLLYHLKERGYRGFSLSRPDKHKNALSKAEKELGGIPSSQAVISAHAEAIEAYIEQHIGVIEDQESSDFGSCGNMPFTRTLLDWSNYDINNRTIYDATVSSGFAIMANQGAANSDAKKRNDITINFAKYSNKGFVSSIIK
jgi:hypothetical protein